MNSASHMHFLTRAVFGGKNKYRTLTHQTYHLDPSSASFSCSRNGKTLWQGAHSASRENIQRNVKAALSLRKKKKIHECFKFPGMAHMFKYMIKSELWSCFGTNDWSILLCVCFYFGKFNCPCRRNRYIMENGGTAPIILDIATIWSWVASFTCRRFTSGNFDVLLTVNLSIILAINQLNAQNRLL